MIIRAIDYTRSRADAGAIIAWIDVIEVEGRRESRRAHYYIDIFIEAAPEDFGGDFLFTILLAGPAFSRRPASGPS